jgi:hypothetical protein
VSGLSDLSGLGIVLRQPLTTETTSPHQLRRNNKIPTKIINKIKKCNEDDKKHKNLTVAMAVMRQQRAGSAHVNYLELGEKGGCKYHARAVTFMFGATSDKSVVRNTASRRHRCLLPSHAMWLLHCAPPLFGSGHPPGNEGSKFQ